MDAYGNADFSPSQKGRKKSRRRRNLSVFAIVAVIAVIIAVCNIGSFSDGTVRRIYDIESNSKCQISKYKDDIAVVNYDGVKFISKTGEEKGFAENHMSNPYVDINGKYMLLYDRDGATVTLYKDAEKVYSYECDQRVKKAKVNKNGYALIVSDETGYNYRISVLTPKGKIEYIWKIGDVYVVDADISPDNNNIAVSSISTDTGIIVENIIFADISKEEETARITNNGSIPLYIKFADSGYAVSVSDDRLCGYSSNGDKKWEASYESRLLKSFDVEDNGNTVLALSGIKNNTIVEMYTKNGRKTGEYETETEVENLAVTDKYIALGEADKVSVINYSGKLLEESKITKDYSDILIIDRKNIILMGTGEVDLLSM